MRAALVIAELQIHDWNHKDSVELVGAVHLMEIEGFLLDMQSYISDSFFNVTSIFEMDFV